MRWEFAAGQRVGPFWLKHRLGPPKTGQGQVWEAEAPDVGPVALKLLDPADGNEDGAIERFERELRAAQRVNHVNVARPLLFDLAGEPPWVAYERVTGKTMDRAGLISHGAPADPSRVLRVFRSLAEGLRALHALGIRHCDLKPANVMVQPNDEVKILDLGGSQFGEGTTLSVYGVRTLGWCAPEQLGAGAVTPAADMWPFGLMLVLYGTGHPARDADREWDWRGLPPRLAHLAAQCLATDPAQRPTAEDARSEIDVQLATRYPRADRVGRVMSRQPSLTPAGALCGQGVVDTGADDSDMRIEPECTFRPEVETGEWVVVTLGRRAFRDARLNAAPRRRHAQLAGACPGCQRAMVRFPGTNSGPARLEWACPDWASCPGRQAKIASALLGFTSLLAPLLTASQQGVLPRGVDIIVDPPAAVIWSLDGGLRVRLAFVQGRRRTGPWQRILAALGYPVGFRQLPELDTSAVLAEAEPSGLFAEFYAWRDAPGFGRLEDLQRLAAWREASLQRQPTQDCQSQP